VKFKPDPSFRYTSSFDTDLRKTFARIRERERQEAEKVVTRPTHVVSIMSRTAQAGTTEHGESRRRKQ